MNILVVDDSKLIQQMALDVIAENEFDATVQVASSGNEALKIINHTDVDLMILDIIMPGLSGINVLEKLSMNQKINKMKVIMFTSLSDKKSMQTCFQLGASDYIGKPIDPEEFVVRVKSALHQRKLEKELSKSVEILQFKNEELLKLNEQINTAQVQLVQKEQMASVGHLAAGVAHEINNPLGFITSNFSVMHEYLQKYDQYIQKSEFLLSSAITYIPEDNDIINQVNDMRLKFDIGFIQEDMVDLYKDTMQGLSRVSKIVEGLRGFSGVDTLEEHEDYNLNEGVKSLVLLTKNETKFIADLEMILDESLPIVFAASSSINQVLLNLMLNALESIKSKYEDKRGHIRIETLSDSEYIIYKIWDNGGGLTKDEIKSIFSPFYTTKDVGEGTGLGLSIAYDIVVNKHLGKLEVDSIYGQYAEFSIYLPRE